MHKIKKFLFLIVLLIPTLLTVVYIYAFSPIFTLTPHASKNYAKLSPTDSFTILFEKPVDKTFYQKNIILTPRTPMKAILSDDHTQITLVPTHGWNVNTKYTVTLPQGRTKNFMQIQSETFNFTTVSHPQVINITPHNGQKDVRLDIEDPITIQFNKSTNAFFIDFNIQPSVPLTYQNDTDKTQFKLLPQEPLKENTQYTLTIRSKADGANDNTFTQIYQTTFTTSPPKPKTWSETLQDRLAEARLSTEAKIKTGKYIDINLTSQIMTIFEDAINKGTFLISSGKPGMGTPKGTHQIYNKHPRPWSNKYGLYMPYWMAITPGGKYGIHELPEWPSGYKEGQNHLGIKVSHGCVRLGVGPAEKLYNWAEIGTPVIVH